MNGFSKVLENSEELQSIVSSIQKRSLPMGIIGLSSVHKAHFISGICEQTAKKALILCDSEAAATKMCDDLNFFCGKAYVYPERDFHFRSDDVCSREYEQQRIGVLSRIIEGDFNFILCSVQAASQFTIPGEELKKRSLTVRSGQQCEISSLSSLLVCAGYTRSEQVEGIGQFSVRGGILDFFPPHMKEPVRIEFWGDEIDSMSCFDTETQRRTQTLNEIKITPAAEVIFDSPEALLEKLRSFSKNIKGKGSQKAKKCVLQDIEKLESDVEVSCTDKYISLAYDKTETLFDYLCDALLFVSESKSIKQNFSGFLKNINQDIKSMFEEGQLAKGIDCFNLNWEQLVSVYERSCTVYADSFARGSFDTPVKALVSVNAGTNASWNGTLSYLNDDLAPMLKNGYTCVVLAGTSKNAKEISYDLETQGFSCKYFDEIPESFSAKTVCVLPGSLSSGFEYPGLKFMLISYKKGNTNQAQKRVKKAKKSGKSLLSIEEITKGDYVVHASYGIGIFDGIKTMTVDGKIKDFIKINFRGSDVLYLPVTQLDLLSKYISPKDTDKPVKLNKLGSDEWNKTKRKVRSAVKDIADELKKIYAARVNTPGYAFSPDIDMQSDFERRFEFDETDDQLAAINEIKADMEKPYPMDRLLCGDVGFGKTEVALRAAFKCIADGKQCAILVPTTILAFQHYQTIKKRFDGFPVEIEMMSRFRTVTQRNKIKKGLKRGSIDLVVGTHSIIASSVEFKDLGLLIVDEEQRFGVAQKEKLKERFPLVDVLTLSATPIPRTLNMAMTGIRDMSVLEIPPLDRHPVQTYVLEYDMDVLAEAMRREIRRGGQVYYLHNRVDSIEQTASKIQKHLPEARIGIGHGKMSEDELSEVWRQLLEGEIDILVCTTIIETGVDVPNANTLIIEDADRLGLAQLHQIRGRVGRSA
ncbi:MAG: transcription-repair coupling factor, partial [Acutalibacteraceae bacterium]